MPKPTIAITLGDPAGIGPEIVIKALCNPQVFEACNPVVIGERSVVERAAAICEVPARVRPVHSLRDLACQPETIDLLDLANIEASGVRMGEVQAHCGNAAFLYVKTAAELALSGGVDAISTGPVNKESLQAARVPYVGHTEMLGGLAGVADPLTMFEVRNLRVFFLSRHVSLRESCDLVTKERLLAYIHRCRAAMAQLGIDAGTLAVAGLNPHCGEHGLFGDEEPRHVEPAVNEARAQGIDVAGPIGADSVFHQALTGRYSAVLSLYHDQGHIATKTLDFHRTISLTLGLPFLRASVDHGTAFDIAGTGAASEVGMVESLLVGAKYASTFRGRDAGLAARAGM